MERIIFLCLSLFLCQISFGQNIPLPQKKPPVEQKKPPVRNPSVRKPQVVQSFSDPFSDQMVNVEGGTFQMGSNRFSNTRPIHSVSLNSYYIGRYPVTQSQWKAVMGKNPSIFKDCDNCPVEQVSWNDIQEFLKKLNQKTGKNYRLPTEAEWEFAARGGNKSKGFEYSGSNNIDDVAWYDSNSDKKTHPVGKKQANELGIYDMTGNVFEWCSDRYDYDYYINSPQVNPTGPSSGSERVLRSSSWHIDTGWSSVFRRGSSEPDRRTFRYGLSYAEFGFPLALSID